MEKRAFLLEHLFWTVCLFTAYQNTLFRCLDNLTFSASRGILLGTIFLSCTVGILLEWQHYCSNSSVFANLMVGFGLYTIWGYFPVYPVFISVVLCTAFLLTLLYALIILCRKISDQGRRYKILRRRAMRAAAGAHRVFGAAFALILFVCAAPLLIGGSLLGHTDNAIQKNQEEQSISYNIEALSQLEEDVWYKLSLREKLNVMQTAANVERCYLGLPNELNVGAANLSENTVASYKDNTHEILLDLDFLSRESSWNMLKALCHEAYHSYQHRIVDVLSEVDEPNRGLKLFHKAKIYEREFQCYEDGKKDYGIYYAQICEKDARIYAESAISDYQTQIEEYLTTK